MKFEWILVSDEIGVKKPHQDFFSMMIEECGFQGSEILFIGDSLRLDILPAKKAGIKALLIDRLDYYTNYDGHKVNSLEQMVNYL